VVCGFGDGESFDDLSVKGNQHDFLPLEMYEDSLSNRTYTKVIIFEILGYFVHPFWELKILKVLSLLFRMVLFLMA
jgi:hypothetical protein